MARKGENIWRRVSDGRWEGRVIQEYGANGKARYKFLYGRSYKEVKEKVKAFESGLRGQKPAPAKAGRLFSDVLSRWMENAAMRVKESTLMRYHGLIQTHILPRLGKYPVDKMSSELIESFIGNLLVSGRADGKGGLSPKTAQDILVMLKSVFQYAGCAVNLEHIKIRKDRKESRIFSRDERDRLVAFLSADTDLTKLGILLSLLTGIRVGELCALRWHSIDLGEMTLTIKETMQRVKNLSPGDAAKTKIIITSPKSANGMRAIPLPSALAAVLKKMEANPNAFVLTGNSKKYAEPRTVQKRFKGVLKEAGLADTNFHTLRHSFISSCAEAGFELKALSEIAGHSSVSITLGRYVHSSFAIKRSCMEKMSVQCYSQSDSQSKSAPDSLHSTG
ncbi:MAG: site-specific integrase [Oscillospiraceae bacterium]|jgi:integrase|nr:site-specific integrase [Oscillospiraceae bacterium]